jgi:hypothetical protein
MNYSELVILAEEIHEGILDKIEIGESFLFTFCSGETNLCMNFTPENINVSTDMYEISDGNDSSIHIKNNEVTHIEKEEEIDGILYSINFKNGTRMIIML